MPPTLKGAQGSRRGPGEHPGVQEGPGETHLRICCASAAPRGAAPPEPAAEPGSAGTRRVCHGDRGHRGQHPQGTGLRGDIGQHPEGTGHSTHITGARLRRRWSHPRQGEAIAKGAGQWRGGAGPSLSRDETIQGRGVTIPGRGRGHSRWGGATSKGAWPYKGRAIPYQNRATPGRGRGHPKRGRGQHGGAWSSRGGGVSARWAGLTSFSVAACGNILSMTMVLARGSSSAPSR